MPPADPLTIPRDAAPLRARIRAILDAAAERGIQACRVGWSDDGIMASFGPYGRGHATLTATDDGQIVGLITNGDGRIAAWEMPHSAGGVTYSAERVAAFIARGCVSCAGADR